MIEIMSKDYSQLFQLLSKSFSELATHLQVQPKLQVQNTRVISTRPYTPPNQSPMFPLQNRERVLSTLTKLTLKQYEGLTGAVRDLGTGKQLVDGESEQHETRATG